MVRRLRVGDDRRGTKGVIEFMATTVQRGKYDATSLADALLVLQRHYGLDSAEFFRAYRAGSPVIGHIPGLARHQWASYYAEWLELTGASDKTAPTEDALAEHTRRDLCVA
jgi:hypothetical protein